MNARIERPGAMDEPRRFRRVLITGVAGSGGSYLAEHIMRHHPDVEIHGLARWHSTSSQDNLARLEGRMETHEGDLNDFGSVLAVLRAAEPDGIFHLASHANVGASFTTPSSVLRNNVEGTVNLLEAVRAHGLDPAIQICSTSEVYGHVSAEDIPIRETTTMRPASPYAVSKCAQDLLGYTYFAAYGMAIVRTRMFTYINPRRADLFASSFAKQVAWVEHGLRTEVVHGNLDSVRTIIDVRDAMRAYWDALCWCPAGEAYNIGGAHTVTVGEVLDTLISLAGRPIPTRLDRSLLRPADVTLQIPSVEKFVAATGWSPRYSLEESIADLLEHWRRRAATAAASRCTAR